MLKITTLSKLKPQQTSDGANMEHLSGFMQAIKVNLDQLLLDPNNPRFAELGGEVDVVNENRFAEEKVQRSAFEKMKEFDVPELRDTIKTLGFLPMDRIVVKEWPMSGTDTPKLYVVVEGNRRVTALKWLIELHESGKENFTLGQLDGFKKLEVLLLDEKRAPATARWILPGLRHVSGIKEWGAYQKARAVFELREKGATAQEAAQSLGLSTIEANRLWRSYHALQQMVNDEEYGEKAKPNLYSYFEEALKRSTVKGWLEWSDEQRKFVNQKALSEFYSWMVGEAGEDGEAVEPKLPEAKSVRDLGKIIDDPLAMSVFRGPDGTLQRALAKFESDRIEDWLPIVENTISVITSLSPGTLKGLTPNEVDALSNLKSVVDQAMTDREKLLSD